MLVYMPMLRMGEDREGRRQAVFSFFPHLQTFIANNMPFPGVEQGRAEGTLPGLFPFPWRQTALTLPAPFHHQRLGWQRFDATRRTPRPSSTTLGGRDGITISDFFANKGRGLQFCENSVPQNGRLSIDQHLSLASFVYTCIILSASYLAACDSTRWWRAGEAGGRWAGHEGRVGQAGGGQGGTIPA